MNFETLRNAVETARAKCFELESDPTTPPEVYAQAFYAFEDAEKAYDDARGLKVFGSDRDGDEEIAERWLEQEELENPHDDDFDGPTEPYCQSALWDTICEQ